MTHTIIADIEIPLWGDDPDIDQALVTLEIMFSFLHGAPASWDDPGYADEVGSGGAVLLDGGGLTLCQHQVDALAHAYLASEDGYRHACAAARDSKFI